MDPLILMVLLALDSAPARRNEIDIDAPQKAALVDLDSEYMNA